MLLGRPVAQGDEDSSKEPEASASVGELFRGKNFKVAVIAFMMFLFQQFSGVNAVFFYSGSVFKQVRGCSLSNDSQASPSS